MADPAAENSTNFSLPNDYRIPRRPVSSQFFENISPVTPISGPSGPRSVSPVSTTSPLQQEITLEVPSEENRLRSPPPYRSASSTGFTAPYHAVGSSDDQYRFEKPRTRRESKRNWMPRWSSAWILKGKADWWLTELIGILLSLISLTIIIASLHKYDGKPLSSWPHSITPNSFLAVFTTLAQAGLMIPITGALVQLKRIWAAGHARDQPSVDLQTFEESSRGPLGSCKLLWTFKGKHLASTGAILSILTLAISPMTQQILTFPLHPALFATNPLPSVAKSNTFTSYNPVGASLGIPDMKMQQAIKSAIFNPANESLPAISPTCLSGNCTFSSFSSLAICSKAANVTPFLSIAPTGGNMSASSGYNATLPNGAYLPSGQVTMNISTPLAIVNGQGVAIANHSIAFVNEPNITFTAINNYFVIFKNLNSTVEQPSFGAIEVLTYWCVNTYSVAVTGGVSTAIVNVSSTNVLGETAEVVNGTSKKYGEMVMSATGNGSEKFTVDGRANQVLAEYMAATFSGYCEESGGERWSSDAAMGLDMILERTDESQLVGVQTFASNIAVSMTNIVRTLPSNINNTVTGTTYISLPHIHVSWGWLSFLIIIIFLSFVFMLATIWKSRRAGVDRKGTEGAVSERETGIVTSGGNGQEEGRAKKSTIRVDLLRGDGREVGDVVGRGRSEDRRGHDRPWSSVSSVI